MEDLGTGYRPYWVGYFDLLGFENRVMTRRRVWANLAEYDKALREIRTNSGVIGSKWFSDTFLFYAPDDSKGAFHGVKYACESFFYRMVRSGIPVRGSLTVGDFYVGEADSVLVGPALIEAYRLAECQDWLGLVLSPAAVARRRKYEIRGDCYQECNVPIHPKGSAKKLQAFNMSRGVPPFSPDEWWRCLDGMEHDAMNFTGPEEREHVLRKYQNSKKFLLSLYPQLRDVVQGECGPILFNKPEIKKKIRDLFGG